MRLAACSIVGIALGLVEPAAAAVPVGRTVLVWTDSKLRLDPDPSSTFVTLGVLRRPHEESLGSVVPMKVVGASGDFLEVEPTTGIECVWAKAGKPADITMPRLYVTDDDLAPVLAKPFRSVHPDGSGFVLQPGVPVGRSGDVRVVSLNGLEVPAPIPDALIDTSYVAHPIAAVQDPREGDRMLVPGDVQIEGQKVTLGEHWTSPRAERRGARVVFPLRARCMNVSVVVPKARVVPYDLFGMIDGLQGDYGHSGSGLYLPKGTPLTSLTGAHVVAATTKRVELSTGAIGVNACIERELSLSQRMIGVPQLTSASASARTLTLCAPISQLVDHAVRTRHMAPVP